jgi:hypothetical protein
MQAINLSNDTFDQDNTFSIEVPGFKKTVRVTACLHKGYQKDADGIFWAMKKSACLKAEYTQKDDEERARLNAMEPVRAGDIVLIEGQQYKVRVLGNYSDCAIFDPVSA